MTILNLLLILSTRCFEHVEMSSSEMQKEIKFYRVNDPYGCFSNFSPHSIEIDGRTWPTSEHYFQAQKFLDTELHDKICRDPSPMRAAEIGRSRKHPLRKDWEMVKLDIMRAALRAKFNQYEELKDILLSTQDNILIEHTHNDRFWGDGGDGQGRNMLGNLLMELREELIKEAT